MIKWGVSIFLILLLILIILLNKLLSLAFKSKKKAYNINDFKQWRIAKNGFEHFCLQSADNLTLAGYYFPNPNSSKLFILAHGFAGDAREMQEYANLFYNLGYSIFLPDARSHGNSSGDYISFGYPERLDILEWINYLILKLGPHVEIGLFGHSMGAATIMLTVSETLPTQVKLAIEDCGYDSLEHIFKYQLKQRFHLLSWPWLPLTNTYMKSILGFSIKDVSPIDKITCAMLPIFFIHGINDTFVPVDMVYSLFSKYTSSKDLYLVKNAGHIASLKTDPITYQKRIEYFINKHWSK